MIPIAKKLAIHVGGDAPRQVKDMLQRQNLARMPMSIRVIPRGAIGCLGDVALPQQGNVFFCTGIPINGPRSGEPADADAAVRLLTGQDGAFAGIFWDARREILAIVTDCLGMQPLYIQQRDHELTLVSETKALRADPDLAAWGAVLSIGHPIGARSLARDLTRVPPASVLVYDCARHRLDVHRYWQWPEPSESWRDYDFLGALERDIRAYDALDSTGTLLLSGGFDSRLLLFLLQRARLSADALIIAHTDECDDADGRLAEAIAQRAGVRYRRAVPPLNFFSSPQYLDYVNAIGAGFPSLGLFISKVASQIDHPAVWDGLVPGFAFMPLHQPSGGFAAYLKQEIRGTDSEIWQAAAAVFKPDVVRAMHDGFAADLQAEVARLRQDGYGVMHFVVENRSRNRAAMNPLKAYANHSRAFTPGLSRDFMAHAATIPFSEKHNGRFYRELFTRLDPRALAVPFLSGGVLMPGTGTNLAYLRERIRERAIGLRTRHPRLFPCSDAPQPARSILLGPHLLDDNDPHLNPRLGPLLSHANRSSDMAWKLLFHWKAWNTMHANGPTALTRLRSASAPTARSGT